MYVKYKLNLFKASSIEYDFSFGAFVPILYLRKIHIALICNVYNIICIAFIRFIYIMNKNEFYVICAEQ